MKRLLLVLLIVFQALPAFAQLVPHDLLHEMHSNQQSNYQEASNGEKTHSHNHSHSHVDTSRNTQDKISDHHATGFVFFTHFSYFMHIDLQSPVQLELTSSRRDGEGSELVWLPNVIADYNFDRRSIKDLRSIKDPHRLDYHRSFSYSTPLYRTTKRLLI